MLGSLLPRIALLPARNTVHSLVHRADVSLVLGLQQQRWRRVKLRKPRWMSIAPSKLFNIIQHPEHDQEEYKQLSLMYNRHHTEMKSLRRYFIEENKKAVEEADKYSAVSLEEVREHERLLEENEKENQRVAKLREERNKQEAEKRVEALLQREAEAKVKLEELKHQVEEIVRREKAISDTYITMDKLDEAIAFAIDNPVSYSYAIDARGNQLWEGTPYHEVSRVQVVKQNS